jgi:hypothetical protein
MASSCFFATLSLSVSAMGGPGKPGTLKRNIRNRPTVRQFEFDLYASSVVTLDSHYGCRLEQCRCTILCRIRSRRHYFPGQFGDDLRPPNDCHSGGSEGRSRRSKMAKLPVKFLTKKGIGRPKWSRLWLGWAKGNGVTSQRDNNDGDTRREKWRSRREQQSRRRPEHVAVECRWHMGRYHGEPCTEDLGYSVATNYMYAENSNYELDNTPAL